MDIEQLQALTAFVGDVTALAIALFAWNSANERADMLLQYVLKKCAEEDDQL